MTWVSLPVGMLRSQRLSRPLSRMAMSRNFPSGEMAVRRALPEVVAGVMEYWAKGRGALDVRKERSTKAAGTSSRSTTMAASNVVFRKPRFAGMAGGMAALCGVA